MGCDIHVHVEVKIKGRWEHYSAPQVNRDYQLFWKMAGVRDSDQQPIAEPRGLPDGISVVTRFFREDFGPDGHSDSWLSSLEMKELSKWCEGSYDDLTCRNALEKLAGFGYVGGNTFRSFVDFPEDRPDGLEDLRVVFWFDN